MSLEYLLLTGALLGISAGVSPGPLLMLVISETVKYGRKEGVKVALAPLITDSPIIIFTVLVLSTLREMDLFLGFLSLTGAAYLLHLGLENLRIRTGNIAQETSAPSSLLKGITANFLNPNPYIFWASVGTPIILKSVQTTLWHGAAFLLSFYFFIVSSKVIIAFLVENIKDFIATKAYVHTLKVLGIVLLFFSCLFAVDAYKYFVKSFGI